MKDQIRIRDVASLQVEKQRLEELCRMKEEKLKSHLGDFRENFFSMSMQSVLPFGSETNDKLSGAMKLGEGFLPVLLGILFRREKKFAKGISLVMKLLPLIASLGFFRKIFSK